MEKWLRTLSTFVIILVLLGLQTSCTKAPSASKEKEYVIKQVKFPDDDLARILGIKAWKFQYVTPQAYEIQCWVELYEKGNMTPKRILDCSGWIPEKTGYVTFSISNLDTLLAENTSKIRLRVEIKGYSKDKRSGSSLDTPIVIDNIFKGMSTSFGPLGMSQNIQEEKELTLLRYIGSTRDDRTYFPDLERLVNEHDMILVLKIMFKKRKSK